MWDINSGKRPFSLHINCRHPPSLIFDDQDHIYSLEYSILAAFRIFRTYHQRLIRQLTSSLDTTFSNLSYFWFHCCEPLPLQIHLQISTRFLPSKVAVLAPCFSVYFPRLFTAWHRQINFHSYLFLGTHISLTLRRPIFFG